MDKFLQIATSTAKEVRNIYNQKEITLFIDKIIKTFSKNPSCIKRAIWLFFQVFLIAYSKRFKSSSIISTST
jgi:hypothetical protein